MAHLANRLIASTLIGVLGGLAGCAAHDGRARVSTTVLTALAEPHREACEALARKEVAVVRRHDEGLRSAERETFHRHAEASLSTAEALGYLALPLGPVVLAVDGRAVTVIAAVPLLMAEAATQPITRAAERARREALARDAALRDCATAFAVGERSASHALELAQALHRTGLRYLAQGDFAEAEQLLRRALAVRGERLFATHTAVAVTLQVMVGLYHARGDHGEASRLQAWLRQPVQPDPVEIVGSSVPLCSGPGC